jgi:hypothetical protein
MVEKTARGLIEYAEAQIGRPYWMGTFGQTASKSLYESNKARLPAFYTAKDFSSQFGQRVHDCAGLIKGYLWSDDADSKPSYLAPPLTKDLDANGFYYSCKQRNTISTMPEIPGTLVFIYSTKTGKMEHIGVYIGNGYCIEAKGHAYGVVKTQFKGRGWTHWGICPFITYDTANSTEGDDDDMSLTQEQFEEMYATMISKQKGDEPDGWAKDACDKAKNKGVFNGDGQGNYNWKDPLTREALATILDNMKLLD